MVASGRRNFACPISRLREVGNLAAPTLFLIRKVFRGPIIFGKRAVLGARTLWALVLLTLLVAGKVWGQKPVVLDHVVAVINGSVILESDVKEEMSYAVLQPFNDAGRNTPKRALQRLIDRDLILQQMRTAETVTPPTPGQVQQRIAQVRQLIPECAQYHCESDAGWQSFLKSKGLTEKEVEAHWRQRLMILSFIQSRFGSGVRITAPEVADYYHKVLIPQLHGETPPPLSTVSSRIDEILLQQRVSSLLLEWLQSLKSEGSVSILDPAYGQVGTTGSGDDDSQSGGGQR
jgi:peptidyl-prolyl cis-trans isomerase SurA